MRKLMWFALGFLAACAVCAYFLGGIWPLLLCLCALASGIPLLFSKGRAMRICAVVLLGCFAGFGWNYLFQVGYTNHAKDLDGQTVQTEVLVCDYSYETDQTTAVEGRVAHGGRSFQVRLYIYDSVSLKPGDKVLAQCKFRYTAKDGIYASTHHQGKGIFLLAYAQDDYRHIASDTVPARFFAARLRHWIIGVLDQSFPADTAPLARALLLGDSSTMEYRLTRSFSISGIRHIIAVSGLHVSVLFSLVWLLCGRNLKLVMLIGTPILLLFAAVAGFTPSVVRACVMQLLMTFAQLMMKQYDPPTALSTSVLILLGVNPMCITDVGFQLTVACMIGIIAFYQPIYQYLMAPSRLGTEKKKGLVPRLHKWVGATVSISLSTLVVTAPLAAAYFGMISVIAILTNLLTIWLILYIFCGIILVCVFSFIWQPFGVAFGWLLAWPMRYVQFVALALGKLPFAAIYMNNLYSWAWLVFSYFLIGLFIVGKKKWTGVLAAGIVGCLILSFPMSWLEGKSDHFRVTVLDVGQGQCILLEHGHNRYLVDCGGSSGRMTADAALSHLNSRGIYRLDGVILTHYDDDHASGLAYVLEDMPVGQIFLPDIDSENRIRIALQEEYTEKIVMVNSNEICRIQDVNITILCGNAEKSDNESGICVLFQPQNYDILITGDRNLAGEEDLLDQIDLPKLELLIAGHHGSANATGLALLQKTRPDTVVISVGDNAYGHPAPALLARLKDYSCRVLRTDEEGTIVFRG